jgi:hypothetical protein
MRLFPARCPLTLLAYVALQASSRLEAQSPAPAALVRGDVRTTQGTPVGGAQVRLRLSRTDSAVAESDERGQFRFARVPAGPAWLIVRRIGYRPDSARIAAAPADSVPIRMTLERIAVELAAVQVRGRRDITGPMAGFYQRMDVGPGHFFTHADIERRAPRKLTDLLRSVPGIKIERSGFTEQVRIRGSKCEPLVWLDGLALHSPELDLDGFDPRSFDGIEIYGGAASVPLQFQGTTRMNASCGTIVLWSRQGEPLERRRNADEITPAGRIARLLDEGKAFLVGDVDVAATPDSSQLVRPIYPDSLFSARAGGQVLAEFVVGADGEPLMETFSIVTTTHRVLVDPVRRAVRQQPFRPAVRQGRAVAQVMQLPYTFVPDSTARRSR